MSNFLAQLRDPGALISGGIGALVAGAVMWLLGFGPTIAAGPAIAGAIVLAIGLVMKLRR